MMAEKVKGCLKGSCDDSRECSRCGWNEKEAARRKEIPLTLCEDGLRRKIIPAEEGEEQREYEAQVEYAQYCEIYEPSYDTETGAL